MATDKKKKTNSALPLLIGAIGFGIAAALLSILYLNAKEKALIESLKGKDEEKVSVVVAAQNLTRGSLVDPGYFSLREMPRKFVHEDAVYPNEFEKYQGRSLTANLGAGKALLKSFLDEEFPVDFSDTIKPGRRALAITVDEINSITGFLRPGNRVDLFVNIPYSESGFNPALYAIGLYSELPEGIDKSNIPGGNIKSLTEELELEEDKITELISGLSPGDVIMPVMQNVRILATGKDPYIESLDHLRQPQLVRDRNFTSVVVDVSAKQAALIAAAQDKGDILAILRNRNDESSASFTTISSRDLFTNAIKMAADEKARAARTVTPAGVDQFGNLVDADGKKLIDKEQLAKAGYSVNENGEIVDKDGNVIDPNDIVIAADGTIMTKQQLAEAGLTLNASGQLVDKNGNVVDANNVVITADGSVLTKAQLEAAGLSVNENGEIVDSNGKVVSADALIISDSGKVMTKEQMEAAGLSLNENGELVDKDGKVIDPNDFVIAADGTVLSKEQLASAGLSINENGEIVDANGNVVDKNDLITAADGTLLSKSELEKAGYSVNAQGQIVDADGKVVSADAIAELVATQSFSDGTSDRKTYQLVIGGASVDGVPKIQDIEIPEPE